MFVKSVTVLVVLSFILRILFIFQGAVSFHYDMSRDAFEAAQIWKDHNFKIIGPPTSTPGLYHGVFYYYLIAIFYGFGNGNPTVVAILLSLLSSLTVIPIMLLAKDFFKKMKWVIIAGLLFSLSFEAIQYGSWISNPGPSMLTIVLFFYFLRLWQKGKGKGLYLAVLMAALSTQFQFFFLYLFILIPVFSYIFKLKITPKNIIISMFIVLLGLSSFIIAIYKFNSFGLIINGFNGIFTNTQLSFGTSFTEQLLNYINSYTNFFKNNFFPINIFIGGILSFIVLYKIKKEKFILFCLLSNIPVFIFGGHSNIYATAGLIAPAILGLIYFLNKLDKKLALFILCLIFLSNIHYILKYQSKGQILLVIPKDMILKSEIELIDKTYQLSKGRPFSINTLTLPLWTNTTWAYLYSWYGKNKYGYVPSFYGHDQIGLLGNDDLPYINEPLETTFFILEPGDGIPEDRIIWEQGSEDSKTQLIEEFKFNGLKLQYRKPKEELLSKK